ncbi:MAG TPA: hypothetical protein VIA18_33590 [Polyangia bacterium]|nr:hypothetical protein [Polyangia bacterium]
MRSNAPALLVLLVSIAAATVRAETVDATLTTILQGRQDPRDGNLYTSVPLYESLTLRIDELPLRHVDDFRLVVSGWGEVQLAPVRTTAGTGDLDLGFVEGKLFRRRLELRLGRQLVFGGAARALPLDGASATVRLPRRIAVNVYGGVPVTPRFGVHQGDFVSGGRLSFRPSVDSEIGASFIEMLKDGLQARQDLGVDARYHPTAPALRSLTLTGYALVSLIELRLVEGDVAATWQALRTPLQLGLDYRRTSPDLFLPRSSILSVFSQETHDEAGGNLYWRPVSRVRVEGDWHAVVDGDGFGQRGGARITGSLGPAFETTLTAEARVLRLVTDDGYVQARVYAVQRLATKLVATLDLDAYWLERAINGQTLSFTSAATLGWDFSPGWRAVVTGIADTTPQVERRVECMAKLVYNAVYHVRREVQ